MKQIFILLMVAMCTTMFTACSDDDNNETRGANGERLVSKLTYLMDGDEPYCIYYNYDKQGRIICESDNDTKEPYSESYIYEKDKITVSDDYSDYKNVYTLNDEGLIIKMEDGDGYTFYFTYNNQNQLIKVSGGYEATYIWENGNIIREDIATTNNIHKSITYTYSSNEDKTPLARLSGTDGPVNDNWGLYAQGYFGMRNKNLCTMYSYTNDYYASQEYKLDKEGYVIEAIFKEKRGSHLDIQTMKVEYK